ncbi:adenylate kinase 2 [Populus alba x Populus x berolinensis]|nr:adenylate kinase 2 [Populus alba x Populus x berolinensis]
MQYGLVHIAAGDLLRAEIASGSENGKRAKEYMEKGQLVPKEIVVMMVKDRLLQPDSQENGWLLDGYPRSLSQATALKEFGFRPDLFIVLEVNEEILVERVVGRRLDPVTGKIYHLKYSPPETEEIAARLTQRFDDTEEKVKLRLQTHHQNVEAVLSMYEDITLKACDKISLSLSLYIYIYICIYMYVCMYYFCVWVQLTTLPFHPSYPNDISCHYFVNNSLC